MYVYMTGIQAFGVIFREILFFIETMGFGGFFFSFLLCNEEGEEKEEKAVVFVFSGSIFVHPPQSLPSTCFCVVISIYTDDLIDSIFGTF